MRLHGQNHPSLFYLCARMLTEPLCAGLLLRLRIWEQLDTDDMYSDRRYFVVHDPEEAESPPPPAGNDTSKTSEPL